MNQEAMLTAIRIQFEYYKSLGDRTIEQLNDADLFWMPDPTTNSIAVVVKHLWGNMRSRWTDVLQSDGEKPWRDREAEFDPDILTRQDLQVKWTEGWACLFEAIKDISSTDLEEIVYIRNVGHTLHEALLRQVAHYAYHVGQIVYIGKMRRGDTWASLSIPRGSSQSYNAKKFAQPKQRGHFNP